MEERDTRFIYKKTIWKKRQFLQKDWGNYTYLYNHILFEMCQHSHKFQSPANKSNSQTTYCLQLFNKMLIYIPGSAMMSSS